MPETKAKSKGKGKGKGLSKKYGPFPVYIYLALGVVIVLVYFYYRRKSQANSPADQVSGSLAQQTIPSGVVVPPSGSATDQTPNGSSDQSTTAPADYITATDLQNAIDNIDNSTAAAIAGITFPTPVVNENITVKPAAVATHTAKTKTAAKKAHVVATHPVHRKAPVRHKPVPKKKPVRHPVRKK